MVTKGSAKAKPNCKRKYFASVAKTLPFGEPLDWMETPVSAKWKLDGKVVDFDWSEYKQTTEVLKTSVVLRMRKIL